MEAAAFINHPSGFLACSPKNLQFGSPGLSGFIAYRQQGKHRIAFGGVHSPMGQSGQLLERFLGDTRNADAWRKKAQDWAPKGSPVYKYFHPDQE